MLFKLTFKLPTKTEYKTVYLEVSGDINIAAEKADGFIPSLCCRAVFLDSNGKMIIQEKSFATQAVMIFLTVMLTLVSMIGNGSFLAIFARFKVLRRNFTNILIASLAVVDLLRALFNVPMFTLIYVVEPDWLKGKTWAIFSNSLHLQFNLLNVMSMSVLMLDRFLVVYLGLKYFTWKTTKNAKKAVFLMWLVCTGVVLFSVVPMYNMDLDGVPVLASRRMIHQGRKLILVPSVTVIFTSASTVLGVLTGVLIHQQKKQRLQLNLPPLAAEARLKMDIKATKTVAMTVATYYICYIPLVVFSVWGRVKEPKVINPWLGFMVVFSTLLSSALNPVIYVSRSTRNRSALRQMLRDPCGASPYKDHPIKNQKEAKQQEKKPPIEEEEIKKCRDSAPFVRKIQEIEEEKPQMAGEDVIATSERPGANPESDKRPPSSVRRVPCDTKIAWGKNEDNTGSLDERVAVKPAKQDDDFKASVSVRERTKKVNSAGRRETGPSRRVKVRPRSLSVT